MVAVAASAPAAVAVVAVVVALAVAALTVVVVVVVVVAVMVQKIVRLWRLMMDAMVFQVALARCLRGFDLRPLAQLMTLSEPAVPTVTAFSREAPTFAAMLAAKDALFDLWGAQGRNDSRRQKAS